MKNLILPVVLAIFLVGCGEKDLTIDASSSEALKSSTQEIYRSLNKDDAAKFKQAVLNVGLAANIVTNNEEDKIKAINKMIGGKTAKEIIAIDEKK
ncbi:hypothetical protein CE143_20270 [Photorhabdus luminescens]|uniref:Uncharacterized protein n=1 Tax=Photorhabdus akhurstii TaxID=171438 RepID=A0ABX8LXK5_9GAMM|nr:DUF6694 family lipoprotein [Photorhabdus akhurstii]QXF35247.1 hypothetical protein B0X70_20225 [Photorhabdus akhurstii]UJD77079.1 hypothetical protein CE143_20270 [Photorhabdus luminescens]